MAAKSNPRATIGQLVTVNGVVYRFDRSATNAFNAFMDCWEDFGQEFPYHTVNLGLDPEPESDLAFHDVSAQEVRDALLAQYPNPGETSSS